MNFNLQRLIKTGKINNFFSAVMEVHNFKIKLGTSIDYTYNFFVPIFDKRLFDRKYNNLPADHFMCEENTLHLGVSDMVTALIFNDLERK